MPTLTPLRRRPRMLAVALGICTLAAATAVYMIVRGDRAHDEAHAAAQHFATAWSRGDDRAAAALTDRPRAAHARLRASRSGLDGAHVDARVIRVDAGHDAATAHLAVRWQVPAFGPFAYATTVHLRRRSGRWQVRWAPDDIHPRLRSGDRLGTAIATHPRGRILDRAGRALVGPRPVVEITVQAGRVRDAASTAARLAQVLDVEPGPLATAIGKAGRNQFVPVITLRMRDFLRRREALEAIPGVASAGRDQSLAPTRDFGRALLGTVGLATAEQVRRSHGRVTADEEVGQSGLESQFNARLEGVPTRSIVTRDALTGEELRALATHPGRRPRSIRTTLDRRVQAAAESALGGVSGNAALVAVRPSSGDVLAAANRPGDSTYDRALIGQYPPGSTFKIVSTTALLGAGLRPDATVRCPQTLTVDGKAFRNFEGEAGGSVSFATDFAKSCNTAFASLAGRLGASALTRTARDFGLGRRATLSASTARSGVPGPTSRVSKAAMMIGQDRITTTPLAMAGVAATVAAGRWHAPRLLSTDGRSSGPPLAPRDLATLRRLMRGVVTSGTGTALARVPGEPAGKTGTAEYGGGNPPPTHAWFVAYRHDLAVAVLVERGSSGGAVAAPLAARFFTALDGGR